LGNIGCFAGYLKIFARAGLFDYTAYLAKNKKKVEEKILRCCYHS
jgi:hypothetical protein